MNTFSFIIHPLNAKAASRKFAWLKYFPDGMIEAYMKRKDPVLLSHVTGIKSKTGEELKGVFIGLPMTPRMMMETMDVEHSYNQILKCAEIAASYGAQNIGLGAFTSIVGDAGETISKRSPIAVTTGNSYTVATAIEAALQACDVLEIEKSHARLAVVGATGGIGRTCAHLLSPSFGETILLGRDLDRVSELAAEIPRAKASVNPIDLKNCDVLVTVSSAKDAIIFPEHLADGAVIVDVARPRDVSQRVSRERPDVLVIEGGVVRVPGDPEFNFNFDFPPKTAYACMCETMLLALEGRWDHFSIGRDITVEQVQTTNQMAEKHGFEISGFRSFEKAVEPEAIERAKLARRNRRAA